MKPTSLKRKFHADFKNCLDIEITSIFGWDIYILKNVTKTHLGAFF